MRTLAWCSVSGLFALLSVAGCGGSNNDNNMPDAGGGMPDSGGVPDNGPMPDLAVDTGPPPECVRNEDCDDQDACTTDTCEAEECVHVNPNASCERFENDECAATIATRLLTIEQTFCVPGLDLMIPDIMGSGPVQASICQSSVCPGREGPGCLMTIESTGMTPSEPSANVLRVQGGITRIGGSVPIAGGPFMLPPPVPSVSLDCIATFQVGSGLTVTADLSLAEEMMCSTDRRVSAVTDIDLSMLTVSAVARNGDILQNVFCAVAATAFTTVINSQFGEIFDQVEMQVEGGINTALSALDCGTCDTECPADLVCRAPLPVLEL